MGMKNRMKLLGLVGTVLAAGAIAAAPVIASADDDAVDAAVFTGQTTSLTPVQLALGSGAYSFQTTSLAGGAPSCLGVSTDSLPSEVAAGCTVTSSGTYSNIVCGTGTATGNATITESDGSTENVNGYTIIFVAGVGVLVDVSGVAGGGGDDAAAVVDITPSQNGIGSPPNCVTQFDVLVAGVIA